MASAEETLILSEQIWSFYSFPTLRAEFILKCGCTSSTSFASNLNLRHRSLHEHLRARCAGRVDLFIPHTDSIFLFVSRIFLRGSRVGTKHSAGESRASAASTAVAAAAAAATPG